MKNIYKISLLIILYSQVFQASVAIDSTNANSFPIDSQQWEEIVNFSNAEVTRFYINFLITKKELSEDDIIEYNNFIKLSLSNQQITKTVSFDKLRSLLESKFNKTLNNVSVPIYNLKSLNDKSSTNLINSIKKILDSVKATEVYAGKDFVNFSNTVERHIEKNNFFKENNKTNFPYDENVNSVWYEKGSIPFVLLILSCVFFLSSTVLLFLKQKTKHSPPSKSNSTHSKTDNVQAIHNINPPKNKFNNEEVEKSNRTIQKLEFQLNTVTDKLKKCESYKNTMKPNLINNNEDIKTKNFPTLNPSTGNNVLYAGKPSEEKVLKEISIQSDPQQTIFKLNILPNNNEVAEFEVFHVSDFMTRSITNAPDDYLYRVCNHENTNQEFRKEILTIKKGIANRIDGEWVVKEENKATIKFQ